MKRSHRIKNLTENVTEIRVGHNIIEIWTHERDKKRALDIRVHGPKISSIVIEQVGRK